MYIYPSRINDCVQCDQLIEQYEPLIVQLLLQALDPEFVCMVSCSFTPVQA